MKISLIQVLLFLMMRILN